MGFNYGRRARVFLTSHIGLIFFLFGFPNSGISARRREIRAHNSLCRVNCPLGWPLAGSSSALPFPFSRPVSFMLPICLVQSLDLFF